MAEKPQNPTPEPGQVWKDNDIRSTGSGEFTIIQINEDRTHALVHRNASGRNNWIRLDRLADTSDRGYSYIGRSR